MKLKNKIIEVCSQETVRLWASIVLDAGLASNRRQAFIWIYYRINSSLDLSELKIVFTIRIYETYQFTAVVKHLILNSNSFVERNSMYVF